jgi:hypothetical protein
MNEKEKYALMASMAGIIQSSGIYNHYSMDTGISQGKAMAMSTNNNSTAIHRPYWEQSTTAAPKQYGYDSDDDTYREPADQYQWPKVYTPDNTGKMPPNWQELWDSLKDHRPDDYDEAAKRDQAAKAVEEARARQHQLLEQIRRHQQEARRIEDERRIDEMIMPSISEPVIKPTPVTPAAAAPVTAPTEVAPIEDELRPLRFSPLVVPKQQ